MLVIAGTDDDMSGGDPHDLAARYRSGRAVTIRGTDHLQTVLSQQFREEVVEFLDSTRSP